MKINMNLLPMKGHYFLFNAGTGPVVPFIPTLAKDLGFSSVVVGTLYTFLPIVGMVAKPTMGGLADRLHCQKAMFIGFIILCLCSFFAIPWIPALPTDSGAELHCDAESMVRICSDNLRGNNCYLDRFRELGNSTVINCQMSCLANSTFLHSICDTWHQPQLCPTPSMSNVTHNTIHFDAQLYPHYIQTDNCMFIRLGRVGFDMTPGGRWVVPYCTDFQAAQCDMACNNAILQELTINHKLDSSQILGLYQFWIFCACLIVGWVSMAVVVSVSDAICFEMLGEFPSKYGNQRLWGSIGWGLFSLLAGVIVDQFSKDQASKNYKPAFILMAVVLLLNALVASKLKYKQVKSSTSILRDVGRLLSEIRMVVFLLWCIAVGMCTAMMWNFLFWHLEELAKGDGCGARNWIKTLEGTVMIVQCFGGELPFFFLSGWILKKLSHVHSMSLVLLAFGARFLLYSALSDPWWVLPIEILNGPTFGMCYAAMTSYASIVAPPGTEATTQGLVGAVFEGLGISLGSFMGGMLFNSMSGSEVFRLFGIGAILCCLLHAIVQWILSRRTQVHTVHEKDFKPPRYASPNDAIHMLEDTLHEPNTH